MLSLRDAKGNLNQKQEELLSLGIPKSSPETPSEARQIKKRRKDRRTVTSEIEGREILVTAGL